MLNRFDICQCNVIKTEAKLNKIETLFCNGYKKIGIALDR